MKNFRIRRFALRSMGFFGLSLMLSVVVWADHMVVRPDREDGVYEAGDTVSWTVAWQSSSGQPTPAATYVFKLGGFTEVGAGEVDFVDGVAHLETSVEAPNALLLEVTWTEGEETQIARGGAVASPERIKPAAPAPVDFDEFWQTKVAELEAVPIQSRLTAQVGGREGVAYWHITMDNIRGSEIHGQLAKPIDGENLPALLVVQWAGVYGLEQSWAVDRAAEGWLTLNILPHDLPIDQSGEFYADQKSGPLKDYWEIGNDDREQSYFLRMYLSCYRAVEYLKSRSDWDGRTLVVMGTSQGGQQALVTAGLHPDVTAAMALVPSGADMLAPEVGREPAFPRWYEKTSGRNAAAVHETSRYFDAVNFAARITVPTLIGIGLKDTVCPPATVWAAANQIKAHTEVLVLPTSGHQDVDGSQQSYVDRLHQGWLPTLREGLPVPVASKGQ